ncbi:MAG: S8 family peptidase [Candidatus Kapabacteria bacterium]|nr:S8 family peptidase [Candidatus Kapabacteria bacterium]
MKIIVRIAIVLFLFNFGVTNSFSFTNVPKKSTVDYKKGRLWVRLLPEANVNEVFHGFTVADRILKPHQSLTYDQYNYLITKDFTTKRASIIRAEEPLLRTFIIEWKDERTNEEVVRSLFGTKQVEFIAYDYLPKLQSTTSTPNDPLISQQDYLDVIKAKEAWNVYDGSPSIVVAVIDDGAAQDHPDLKDNIAVNTNEIPNNNIDDDGNGYIDDYNGLNFAKEYEDGGQWGNTFNPNDHGNGVTGIVGATANNGIGIAGVGNKCRVFPLKVFTRENQSVKDFFGYQALVYAALRGFKVANCSWGVGGNKSPIFQSIIDFCVARDMAIVVAAGNESTFSEAVYPASYFGVLGVGETDLSGRVTPTSSLGANLGVMAPGNNSYSISGASGYAGSLIGTSYASPMVAGVVALILGKYPELTAMEALEHARNSVDDISAQNQFDAPYIGGSINALKAVSNLPLDKPGIRPLRDPLYKYNNGQVLYSYKIGDTVNMYLPVKNFLGASSGINCTLTAPSDFSGSVSLINPTVTIANIARNEEQVIGPFQFVVNSLPNDILIFRIDFNDGKGYSNFAHTLFVNQKPYSIIQNDSLIYSLFANGTVGYEYFAGEKIGEGFGVRPISSFLENAILMYTAGNNEFTASTAYSMASETENEFKFDITKPIYSDNNNLSVFNKNGVEIEVKAIPHSSTTTVTRHTIKLKNTNQSKIDMPSIGYYMDWDLGPGGSKNSVTLFPEATMGVPFQNSALKVTRPKTENTIGMSISSKESDLTFKAIGENRDILRGSSIYSKLRGQNEFNNNLDTDIAASLSITFEEGLAPGEEKECFVCMGFSHNAITLEAKLKECMNATYVSVQEHADRTTFEVFPNPTSNVVNIVVPRKGQLVVRNLSGKEILSMPIENRTSFTTNSLPIGVYLFEHIGENALSQTSLVTITR